MFLLLITFYIINLKMIRDVFLLKNCHQCGGDSGETLGPVQVVKHSVHHIIQLKPSSFKFEKFAEDST